MDVINDLTSSLSSDLNSTELAKDLGLGFLFSLPFSMRLISRMSLISVSRCDEELNTQRHKKSSL